MSLAAYERFVYQAGLLDMADPAAAWGEISRRQQKVADYLNAVVALRTGLSTHGLLRALQDVEERFGRVRGERWGPRTLDLDLLAHGAVNVDDPVATVPHPRLHHRAFVLVPLREIDPWWRHPVTGETAEGMLARLDASGVERTELAW